MCSRCLAASFRPKTDPTMSRKIEDRYERLLLPLFDRFETKAVAAFESRARELAAPTVGIDLEWLRVFLEKTIEEVVIKPSHKAQGEIVKTAYRQGVTWADTNLSALTVGAKLTPGPIDWRALDVLKARNVSALKGVTDEMGKQIISSLTDGLVQGEGIPKLAKRIAERVDAIGRTRATAIARTETMYAVNQGTLIRYSQAGVRKVRWLTGLDERACEECESLHGNEYEIGSEPAIPAHPRCRCTVIPVIGVPGTGDAPGPAKEPEPESGASQHEASARAFEREIQERTTEKLGIFTQDGTLAHAIEGDTGSVKIPPDVKAWLRKNPGAIEVHNHPAGDTVTYGFSLPDMVGAVENNLQESRVIHHDGTRFIMTRPEEGWPKPMAFFQEYMDVKARAHERWYDDINGNAASIRRANLQVGHEITQELSETFRFGYRRIDP